MYITNDVVHIELVTDLGVLLADSINTFDHFLLPYWNGK